MVTFKLPDSSVKRTLNQLQIDTKNIKNTIEQQHLGALKSIEIDKESLQVDLKTSNNIQEKAKLYDTRPSKQALMQQF